MIIYLKTSCNFVFASKREDRRVSALLSTDETTFNHFEQCILEQLHCASAGLEAGNADFRMFIGKLLQDLSCSGFVELVPPAKSVGIIQFSSQLNEHHN